jgi:hypothetical protein
MELSQKDWEAIAKGLAKQDQREFDANSLLQEGVALLVSACAAPARDDTRWPGGWRGVDAFQEDIQRLASIGLTLYKSWRYPQPDRVERAIEALGVLAVDDRRSELHTDGLLNVTGWRIDETALERTSVRFVGPSNLTGARIRLAYRV